MNDQELKQRLADLRQDDTGWAESAHGRAVLERVSREEAEPRILPGSRVTRRVGAAVGACVLAVGGGVTAVSYYQHLGGQPGAASMPSGFTSARQMVAESDIIVVGRVEGIKPTDRPVYWLPKDEHWVLWEVNLEVDQQLTGPATGAHVVAELYRMKKDGRPQVVSTGDRVLWALDDLRKGEYVPSIGAGAQFRITSDNAVTTHSITTFSQSVDGQSLARVKERIRAARSAPASHSP